MYVCTYAHVYRACVYIYTRTVYMCVLFLYVCLYSVINMWCIDSISISLYVCMYVCVVCICYILQYVHSMPDVCICKYKSVHICCRFANTLWICMYVCVYVM